MVDNFQKRLLAMATGDLVPLLAALNIEDPPSPSYEMSAAMQQVHGVCPRGASRDTLVRMFTAPFPGEEGCPDIRTLFNWIVVNIDEILREMVKNGDLIVDESGISRSTDHP